TATAPRSSAASCGSAASAGCSPSCAASTACRSAASSISSAPPEGGRRRGARGRRAAERYGAERSGVSLPLQGAAPSGRAAPTWFLTLFYLPPVSRARKRAGRVILGSGLLLAEAEKRSAT